jgi:hypothetical protein
MRFDTLAGVFRRDSEQDAAEANPMDGAQEALIELKFRLAESYLDGHCEGAAIPILEELWTVEPTDSRFGYKLMLAYLAIERADLARRSFERLFENKKRYAHRARKEWQALATRNPNSLSPRERASKMKIWKNSRTNLSGMGFLRAWLLHAEGKTEEALGAISQVDENKVYNLMGLLRLKADCLLIQKRWSEAEGVYAGMLDRDGECPEAFLGLANLCYQTKRYGECVSHAKTAISLRYFNPLAHYLYGAAIYRCGQPRLAADALTIAVQQSPFLIGAYQRLVALYRGPLADPGKADYFETRMEQAREEKVAFDSRRRDGADLPSAGDRDPNRTPSRSFIAS